LARGPIVRPAFERVLFSGSGPEVLLDEYRDFGLADPAPRDTQDQIFDFLSIGVAPARAQTEKGEKDHEPDALVRVSKGVISHDVEEMGRRHLMEAFVQEPPFNLYLQSWGLPAYKARCARH
jgi:hypothetical protein